MFLKEINFEKKSKTLNFELKPITIFTGSCSEVVQELIRSFKFARGMNTDSSKFDYLTYYGYDIKNGTLLEFIFDLEDIDVSYLLGFSESNKSFLKPFIVKETLWIGDLTTVMVEDGNGFVKDDDGSNKTKYLDSKDHRYKSALSRSVYFGHKPVSIKVKDYFQNIDLISLDSKILNSQNEFAKYPFERDNLSLAVIELVERGLHPLQIPGVAHFLERQAECEDQQFIISTFSTEFLNNLTIDRKGNLDPMIRILYVWKEGDQLNIRDFNDLRKDSPSLDGWACDFGIGSAIYNSSILREDS